MHSLPLILALSLSRSLSRARSLSLSLFLFLVFSISLFLSLSLSFSPSPSRIYCRNAADERDKTDWYPCHTLHYNPTHCNTLQQTATQRNTHCFHFFFAPCSRIYCRTATDQHGTTARFTLQHTTTHCNTLQHTATQRNTTQHNAPQLNTLLSLFLSLSLLNILQDRDRSAWHDRSVHPATHYDTL